MKTRGFEVLPGYSWAKIPQRATSLSAGYDIRAAEDVTIFPNESKLIATGVRAYMQPDEWLGLYIRSGLALKSKLTLQNSVGIVDCDFGKGIGVILRNEGIEPFVVSVGDRICQAVFHKYLTTDEDQPVTIYREGGYGSTGR